MLVWVSVAPLGNPVVPDVYWMLIGSPGLQAGLHPRQRVDVGRRVGDLLPRLPPDDHHVAERGAPPAHIVEHQCVVGALERRRREDRAHRRLVQHVLQLVGPVRGIDVHQNRADLRGRVLDHRPLGGVRRPYPDPVAGLGAAFDQCGGDPAGRFVELAIGPAAAGRALDQRLPIRELSRSFWPGCRRSSRRGAAGWWLRSHRTTCRVAPSTVDFSTSRGTRHRRTRKGRWGECPTCSSATKAGRYGRTRSRAILLAVHP